MVLYFDFLTKSNLNSNYSATPFYWYEDKQLVGEPQPSDKVKPTSNVVIGKNYSVNVSPIRHGGIFYFGITHHSVFNLTYSADKTWARKCNKNGFLWFADEPDPNNILQNLIVIKPSYVPSDYANIYHRTLLVWKYVLENFAGYDWYLQAWEDNYIIPERLAAIAARYNASELIEIGAFHNNALAEKLGGAFLDGGSTHLMSRGVFEAWGKVIHHWPTSFEGKYERHFSSAEDLAHHFYKKQYLNIKYVNLGSSFNYCGPSWASRKDRCTIPGFTANDVACFRNLTRHYGGLVFWLHCEKKKKVNARLL